ncbi:MAG: PAS domain-containing protein [Desulfamplus sp.]|nr:PAS domain-containing protein [Desulfamplus sp.]
MVKQEYLSDWVIRAQKIAHLGIWDQDPTTDELWWSDETFKLLGLEPQSTVPSFEKFLQSVHPDDRALIVEKTELVLKSDGQPYEVEYRIILPDTSERILHEEALIERDEAGIPTKITGIIQDITERKRAEIEREKLINQLQTALDNVKTLKGLLPICMHCKKIRDDKGYWNNVEVYIQSNSEATFSHSLCKECAEKYYPDYDLYND